MSRTIRRRLAVLERAAVGQSAPAFDYSTVDFSALCDTELSEFEGLVAAVGKSGQLAPPLQARLDHLLSKLTIKPAETVEQEGIMS